MEHEALLVLAHQRIDDLLVASGSERGHYERLSFATGEECRAVRARGDVHLGLDRADLVGLAAVGALLVDGDPLANAVLLELREGGLDLRDPLTVLVAFVAIGAVLLQLLERS